MAVRRQYDSVTGRRGWPALVFMLVVTGCQVFVAPPNAALQSLLTPVTTSPESVTLEIFQARIPLDKEHQADALWEEIDEQCFSAELRRGLLANGLRAGIVGSTPPQQLSDLLALQSEAPDASSSRVITGESAVPRVTKQVKQLNRRDQLALQVSDVRDEAQVLLSEDGVMGGKTFNQAQGVYGVRAEATAGQRVKVRVTPELQHGDLKLRYAGHDQGVLLKTPSREREVFERLVMETELAPGELLVLGCLPDARSSLGGVFHTAVAGGREERKIVVIRLLQVPPTEILAAK